jgi:hypothetical protein
MESVLIDNYIKDSYVIGKDNKEIKKFIDIYLDKLKMLENKGEDNIIKDIKKGLSILYSRLK